MMCMLSTTSILLQTWAEKTREWRDKITKNKAANFFIFYKELKSWYSPYIQQLQRP